MAKTKNEAGADVILETEAEVIGKMKSKEIAIPPPNFKTLEVQIEGTAPYVQNAFSQKARDAMRIAQELGSKGKKGKKKEPKDFKACYEGSKHVMEDGTCGIPAPAFRDAMISACRICGFKMTQAKLSVFALADGIDRNDKSPLVRITRGTPEYFEAAVRLATGVCDIRARAQWSPGWRATVRIHFDADLFSDVDIMNLLARAGMQVGIGEGRPDSKKSCGMGWGLFKILSRDEAAA